MARPTTKADVEALATLKFNNLTALLETVPDSQKEHPFTFDYSKEKGNHWERDKNIRDVLIHLYEWHQLLLNWTAKNTSGDTQPFLPVPYNWRTYGELNITFVQKHQKTSEKEAETLLQESHKQVMQEISTFSNEELFSKDALSWTGGSTLGSYCVSVTSSHYDWAIKKIKKQLKAS